MNHDEATRFFDELSESTDSRPPTADLLAAGRTAERRKRRNTIGASVVAVALILGGGAVAQVMTQGDGGDAGPISKREPQSTTADETVEAGRRIVDRYIAQHPREDVTSATVLAKPGTVRQPNTGKTCESGQLLHIDLFGSFPDITTSQPPGGDGTDGLVRKVMLTADAESEEVCLIGVHTGAASADPEATLLFGPEQDTAVPTSLSCPTDMRASGEVPFFDESAPGSPTPEGAVEAWLSGQLGKAFGTEYLMDSDRTHAWILRPDGTAVARVRVKLTSGGGYFYYGHEACG